MEHLFTPTRRLQDEYDSTFYSDSDEALLGYTEVQLTVSAEAFLKQSWDWSEFQALFTGDEGEMWKIIWIAEDTFIYIEDDNSNGVDDQGFNFLGYCFAEYATFTSTSGEEHVLILATLLNSASLLAGASSVFWRAVTASKCDKLKLNRFDKSLRLLSGPALSHFQTAILGLEHLEYEHYTFKGDDYRTLATLERTGLEVTFQDCSFDAQDAEETCTEWLRHSQVVTKLDDCEMADSIICALSGNKSVKTFSFDFDLFNIEHSEGRLQTLAQALQGNLGIENLRVLPQSNETRSLLLRSLWAHPRIQSVTIPFIEQSIAESKTIMMNEVLRMVQCNTVVRTINLQPNDAKYEEFFQNSIVPRLEMNRSCFEDQRRALTRADPSIRGQLLGRALHVVRYNPDLLFRFLSENVPAFARSDEDGPSIPTGRKRKVRS
jgi:hypothetical protein